MLIDVSLDDVLARIANKDNFVLNIIARWCPDCTERQVKHIADFANQLAIAGLDVLQLNVQVEKRIYLNQKIEDFVNELGGHGFPRTVLFVSGQPVDTDNVEVITDAELNRLAEKFAAKIVR